MSADDGFSVRQGAVTDLDQLVALTLALAAETEDGLRLDTLRLAAGVRRGLEAGEGADLSPRYWVAEQSGRLVGFIGISPEWSDWWATTYWWVISVFVECRCRRRGVATQLFASMQADADDANVQTVNLRVECGNAGAQKFYKSIGFAVDPSHLVMSKGRKPDGRAVGGETDKENDEEK